MIQHNRTLFATAASVAACALVACVHLHAAAQPVIPGQAAVNQPPPGPAAQNTGLATEAKRITDEKIMSDRQSLQGIQTRLQGLSNAGVAQQNYALAKAQCWLDSAKTQYHENDRTGYVEESMAESIKIVQALEADKKANAGLQTPLVAKSSMLRQDLWDELTRLKGNADTLVCNARTVACAEVRLVRAGHANNQTGWRQATPHIQMVEDSIRRAEIEAKACVVAPVVARAAPTLALAPAPAAQPPAPPPPPAAPPPPPPQIIEREVFVLTSDALFAFNKGAAKDLLNGKERLEAIANQLKSYKSIQTLAIAGHTDRFGSDALNDALSVQRAETVKKLLTELGVKAAQVQVLGKGKREPVSSSTCPASLPREKAIVCLQTDRRVVIEARGIVK